MQYLTQCVSLVTSAPKSTSTANTLFQFLDNHNFGGIDLACQHYPSPEKPTHPLDHKLRNAIPSFDCTNISRVTPGNGRKGHTREIHIRQIKQQNLKFTAIIRINNTSTNINRVLRSKTTPRRNATVYFISPTLLDQDVRTYKSPREQQSQSPSRSWLSHGPERWTRPQRRYRSPPRTQIRAWALWRRH